MILTDRTRLAVAFREMRINRRLSQRQLGERLHISTKTVSYRENHQRHIDSAALIATAHVFGYDLALIPKRHPGARPTGTGWPT